MQTINQVPQISVGECRNGSPHPLGATWTGEGVNFAVFSAYAEAIELCVFDASGRRELGRTVLPGRTGHVRHGFLPEAGPGLVYGYRAHGKYAPRQGHRFNRHKLLLDPHAHLLVGSFRDDPAVYGYVRRAEDDRRLDLTDSAPFVPKAVVMDPDFDWRGDTAPGTPWERTVIYELHVKGFTRLHPDVPAHLRGRYLALAHPAVVDYLLDLGVTAVELLPCQAFLSEAHLTEKGLSNYWGYNPVAFSAPHPGYALADPVREFREMVRVLHLAGIEVILDVVYNHTAEGDHRGPTLSLRGLDNASYYALTPGDQRHYQNHTGCGNALALDHPDALRLVLDSLRFWVNEMHVDGFRFDLATTLAREEGRFTPSAAFFKALYADPVLNRVKLIAEPWDVGPAGYQVGSFPVPWAEWNDRYRDVVRGFWRGDPGLLPAFAERIAGSSDLFRRPGRSPVASINFLACHDGFTLHDTVSYATKHNEANGEGNRDGDNHAVSWNSGVEGETSDPAIIALREKQKRNLMSTLLLSQGTPMIQAGDEFGRTQRGNNNAYCQDNLISWVDWQFRRGGSSLRRLVRELIRLRKGHPVFRRTDFLAGIQHPESQLKDVTWLTADGREMIESDWHDPHGQSLAVLLDRTRSAELRAERGAGGAGDSFLLIFNTGGSDVEFVLPAPITSQVWEVVFDTSQEGAAVPAASYRKGHGYMLHRRSMALLADRG
jgi:glycogen operon protein